MPKRHPPEVRAAAVAAVASGEQPAQVARRFGISQGRLADWTSSDLRALSLPETSGSEPRARSRELMGELIYDTLVDLLGTVRLQLQAAAADEWLAQQSAADVAQLLGVELDRAIRLLAGFRPAEDRPRTLELPANEQTADVS